MGCSSTSPEEIGPDMHRFGADMDHSIVALLQLPLDRRELRHHDLEPVFFKPCSPNRPVSYGAFLREAPKIALLCPVSVVLVHPRPT